MRKTYIFLLLTAEIFFGGILLSQPTLEWERVYPDSNTYNSGAIALALDDSGNVYITGYEDINQGTDYCTIKYSPGGIRQWISLFPASGTGTCIVSAITTDNQSNVYITGYRTRYGTMFDFCTVKYNSNGVEQWVKYYDGPIHSYDQAQKIAVDNAGNVYVSGFITINNYDARIYTTIKYTKDGDSIWTRAYGSGDIGTDVNDIRIDENCNIYITGECDAKAVTVKYDSSGNQKWANTYSNSSYYSTAESMTLDKNNNVIITGYTFYSANRRGYFTIKYSNSGLLHWVRAVAPGEAMNCWIQSNYVCADENNNIIISGYSHESDTSRAGTLIRKYTNEGDSIWHKIDFSDTLASQFTFGDIDNNDNIYLSGAITDQNTTQIRVSKYDSSGVLKWRTFTGYAGTNSVPRSIRLDKHNNIYITGSKDPLGLISPQMLTLKYSQVNGIINSQNNITNNYKLYQNYPNPFNPNTKIKFSVPVSSNVKCIIVDILGREIAVLINKYLKTSSYEINWDASNFSSGIYFYRLQAGQYTDTKKMILIK